MARTPMLLPAFVIFFTAGFAALLYQIAWQRMLVVFSGADVYSATVVITAFMAGLGCGSLAGGHVADRVSRVASLALFAGVEAGIALFGFQSKTLLYDVMYQQFGHLAAHPVLMATLLVAALAWPTFLMGMSLPLLARALARRVDTAARTIGSLYAANTLGAAAGALCGTWLLIPHDGLEGSLRIAATLNLVCAASTVPLAAAMAIWRRADAAVTRAPVEVTAGNLPLEQGQRDARGFAFSRWIWLYALSGFIGLSLEIIWFRLLGVMLKSTAFTFGTLLAQYLFWLGLGSLLGSLVARTSRRPSVAFLSLQTAAVLYAGASLTLLVAGVAESSRLSWLSDYFGSYDPLDIHSAAASLRAFVNDAIWHTPQLETLPAEFLTLYFVLPAILFGPSTLLMGLSFPMLQKAVQTDLARIGRRVGSLLLANIAGSTVGTAATGWLLLSVLGTAGTLRLLVAVSGLFAVIAIALGASRRRVSAPMAYMAVAALVIGAVAVMPGAQRLWATLHGTEDRPFLFAEDATGVSVLKAAASDFSQGTWVYVNGLGQSSLPYGGIHTELGALPAFLHPEPRDAAIIGLGSGDTLFGMAGRKALRRIVSIEIVRPQIETLRQLSLLQPYPALVAALGDPRIEHVVGDGRLYVKHAGVRYDILEADALRPNSAFAGNLYSDTHFALLRDHLKPGGLAVTWAPTERVVRTFLNVYPHVIQFRAILIGSSHPIPLDREAIERRLNDPAVQSYYAHAGIDIQALLLPLLANAIVYPPDAHRHASDINTDLHPRDEIGIPLVFDPSMLRHGR